MPDLSHAGAGRFISDDKKVISLPVPLGTTVFTVGTSCGHFCYWQQKLFDEHFPNKENGHCSVYMPCHTIPWGIYVHELKFSNMQTILDTWGDRTFATREEAEDRMKTIVEANRTKMRELGFQVDLNGNGYLHNTQESED